MCDRLSLLYKSRTRRLTNNDPHIIVSSFRIQIEVTEYDTLECFITIASAIIHQ